MNLNLSSVTIETSRQNSNQTHTPHKVIAQNFSLLHDQGFCISIFFSHGLLAQNFSFKPLVKNPMYLLESHFFNIA